MAPLLMEERESVREAKMMTDLGDQEDMPAFPCKTWLVVMCLLIAAPAGAAELVGVLLGEESKPLSYGVITVIDEAGEERVTLSGMDGSFRITNLHAGAYGLRATYLGYKTEERQIKLNDEEPTRVEIRMKIEAIRLEAKVIEGDRLSTDQRVQTGVVRLQGEEIETLPGIIESDPVRTLQLLPGVQAASDISSGLYVRGAGPDQNLTLLDGVPIYNPTHAFGLFSSFNPDAVEAVTLYKGAYPARYGGRLGSVLDVQNEAAPFPKTRVEGAISTIAARLKADISLGAGGLSVYGRRTYLDPFLEAASTPEDPLPDYYFYDLGGKYTLPAGKNRWELWGYLSKDDLGLDAAEGTGVDLRWGNQIVSGNVRRQLTDQLAGRLTLWRSYYESEIGLSIFTTPIESSNSLEDLTVAGDLRWSVGEHLVAAGISGASYDFRYQEAFDGVSSIDFRSDPVEVDVYAEDTWNFNPGSTLRGGLRTRYISDGDRLLWEPRISWSEALGEKWAVKLGGGIYYQYLQLITTEGFSGGDLYVPIDETVPLSRSLQGVLGFEYIPVQAWRFTAEGYYTDLSDLVEIRNDVPADQASTQAIDIFYTGGTGYATGLELFAERRMGSIRGWVGYTLGWTRRNFDELNQGNPYPPKYDRRHDLSAVGQYRRGKWTFGLGFVYGTGQAVTGAAARYGIRNPATGNYERYGTVLPADRNGARLLPYNRLDLSVTRDFSLFGTPAAWKIQIFNVYSRRNDWFVTYDNEDPAATPEITKQLPIIPSLGLEFAF